MSTANTLTREEHLLRLQAFSAGLVDCLQRSGMTEAAWKRAFLRSVSAECLGCGLLVSSNELLSLGRKRVADESAKVRRMRLGDCGRKGCNAFVYKLSFRSHPVVDWPKVIESAEPFLGHETPRVDEGAGAQVGVPAPETER
jgi:hypothetical protein